MKPAFAIIFSFVVGPVLAFNVLHFSATVVGAGRSTANTVGVVGVILYFCFALVTMRRGIAARAAYIAKFQPGRLYQVAVVKEQVLTRAPGQPTQSMALAEVAEVAVLAKNVSIAGVHIWWELKSKLNGDSISFPEDATGAHELLAFIERLPTFDTTQRGLAVRAKEASRFVCWRHDA